MTIKELADALGVSKTAVRKYMTEEFRCEHTETSHKGLITIDSDGCKLIAMHLGRTEKLAESTENKIPETAETPENSENLVIPRAVWDALNEQLKEKDRQLAAKDKQIGDLTEAVKSQAQSINADRHNELAGTMKGLLPDGEPATVDADPVPAAPKKKAGLFGWLFGEEK